MDMSVLRLQLSFFWLLLIVSAGAVAAEMLTTANFVVTITRNCPEGSVTCDDVSYRGVAKKSGKAITLKGGTMHTTCADGVSPCRFLGYRFRSGDVTYLVWESGVLEVRLGKDKRLIEERGEWKY
jgi:hypothetical protein